jgi:hypothetical protein
VEYQRDWCAFWHTGRKEDSKRFIFEGDSRLQPVKEFHIQFQNFNCTILNVPWNTPPKLGKYCVTSSSFINVSLEVKGGFLSKLGSFTHTE